MNTSDFDSSQKNMTRTRIIWVGISLALVCVASVTAMLLSSTVLLSPRIVSDSEGHALLCRTLTVILTASADPETMTRIVQTLHGRVIRQIPTLRAYTLAIPGLCNARTVYNAINAARALPGVESAAPEGVVSFQ